MDSRLVRVCVVSGHLIVAAGIRAVVAGDPDGGRFAFVADPADAEVVIFDAFNLAVSAEQAAELADLVAAHPDRVLVLSRLLQPSLTARALATGAVAPVSIGADADELIALIDATASGAITADAELARENLDRLTGRLRSEAGLTPRQQTVLALIAAGYSNDQIAAELYLSINTIKSAIRSTYARLGVRTRAQAVAWAVEHGYATLPPTPRRHDIATATN